MSWQQMSQLKELAIAPGVLQEAMQATRPCRRLWTMHAGLALTAPLYNPMASAISPIPSKLMPRMLLTVTFRERAWPLAPVTSLAVPPLQKLIPVRFLNLLSPFFWSFKGGFLLIFVFCVVCFLGYGSCMYPSSLRYVLFFPCFVKI